MTRNLLFLSLIVLAACDNPAAPAAPVVTEEAPQIPPPPPSRKIVATSSVIDLGKPSGAMSALAYDVNEDGEIAGFSVNSSGQTRAFSWSDGFRTLNPLSGYAHSFAFGIGDKGRVIGTSQDANGRHRATVWDTDGAATSLGTLATGGESIGKAINRVGFGAGNATVADGSMRGFFYVPSNKKMTSVGLLPGGTYTVAQDLNDSRQVTGHGDTPNGDRAYIYSASSGSITSLGTIPNGTSSYALSINNSSQVVGFAFTAEGQPHAFLWSNNTMIDLGTLGGGQSAAYGINDSGEIVGYSQIANGEYHAFVWTAQSGMVDLGALPGGTISYAQKINSNGLTTGIALGLDGRERAVRWDVVLK